MTKNFYKSNNLMCDTPEFSTRVPSKERWTPESQTGGRWLADLRNKHHLGTSVVADRHAVTLGNFGHRATVDCR